MSSGPRGDLFNLGAARRRLPAVRGLGPPRRSGDHVLSSWDAATWFLSWDFQGKCMKTQKMAHVSGKICRKTWKTSMKPRNELRRFHKKLIQKLIRFVSMFPETNPLTMGTGHSFGMFCIIFFLMGMDYYLEYLDLKARDGLVPK